VVQDKKKLNKEQLQAVKHDIGPLLIIAGAGTGKTTVVTERIKHLILKKDIKPSEILALTFTEKAAREMEERVDKVLPYGYTQMWISTFHSFCDRVLRDSALNIGLDPRYKLTTEAETTHFVRKNLFEFELAYFRPLGNPTKFISGMLQHFSRLQDEDISPTEYIRWANSKFQIPNSKKEKEDNANDKQLNWANSKLKTKNSKLTNDEVIDIEKWVELANAYKKYDDLKIKNGLMDYGDLIVKTLKLFRERPNVLKEYKNKFKYILVDEFQDTNFAQNELAIMLAGKDASANITVTGDDDQSVYRFRGAAVSNIIHFRNTYPKAKAVVLTKNYRTAQDILDKAYTLIQNNNPDRLEVVEKVNKRLVSQRNVEGEVRFIHEDRVENEADEVAKIVRTEVEKGYSYKDFAVLVRANNHSEAFIRAFQRYAIPYQFLGPGRLFRQPEIVDLISYLRVLYDFEDSVSFYRLLSVDHFEIPARDLVRIGNYAKRLNISLFEAVENIEDIYVGGDTKIKIKKLTELVNKHIKLIKKETAGQLLYYFLENTGLLKLLLSPDTPDAQKRVANISKLFDKLKTYEVEHEDAGVFAVVDWIDLSMELGESPLAADTDWTSLDAVSILTAHSAKGLEFPQVFLVNLVSQRFPSTERKEQIPIPDELIKEVLPQGDYHMQEERRLFYVGMTRAKDKLYLTAADYYGEGKREKKLSPFIFEALGDEALAAEKVEAKGEQLSFLDYEPKAKSSEALAKEDRLITRQPFHVDYLSYSQIETFKTCPLHYKLKYVLKIPSPPSGALSFGISVHAALKDFYDHIKGGEKASRELLHELLEKNWVRVGYLSHSHEEQMKKNGRIQLSGFLKDHFNEENIPLAQEKPFIIPLQLNGKAVKVGGKIDRIDELSGGRIEIVDYKTGANVPTQREVDDDKQLAFYALAATKTLEPPFNKKPEEVKLSLYYLETQQKFSTTRTIEQLNKVENEIFDWKEKIETSDFKCTHGYFCNNCEYKLLCAGE
jgi:DNA helicase II / ATP-dependent DNA helicase PcrA